MLLPRDTKPEKTAYFNGALIIKALESRAPVTVDFFELFGEIKRDHGISLQAFIYALDWLFLLGSIKLAGNGEIEKCF